MVVYLTFFGSGRESVELLDFGGFSLLGVKAVRRRRRGGNVGIPRFVRDSQGWGESGKGRVWTFPRFPRPAISTAGVRSAAWLLVLSHSAGKSERRAVPGAGPSISKKPRRLHTLTDCCAEPIIDTCLVPARPG